MSAPCPETGADVARWLAMVQARLHWRGLRAPVERVPGGYDVALPAIRAHLRQERISRHDLFVACILLRGLSNYYVSIGARSDAVRMHDMMVIVDQAALRM